MMFIQMTVLVALVGYTIATGYGGGAGGASGGYGAGAGGSAAGGYGAGAGGAGGGASYGGGAGGAAGFGGGSGASRGFGSGGSGGFGGGSGYTGGIVAPPQPYQFDYTAADEQGNSHYRNEQGDQNGNVRGSYGYTDNQGLYRVVEYVADENGFRANVRTNEPGTDGKESPADVVLTAEQPPAGIQDRWSSGGAAGYAGGARGGFSGGAAGGSAVSYGGGAGSGAGASYGGGASSGFSGAARGGAGVRSGKSGY